MRITFGQRKEPETGSDGVVVEDGGMRQEVDENRQKYVKGSLAVSSSPLG